MSPIRRELLNGLFVLVVASLMSVAFAAFQVNFNVLLWVLILMGTAMAVGGYAVFEFIRSNEEGLKKTEERETEWLKRVGTPARLDLGFSGTGATTSVFVEHIRAMSLGSDLTVMIYYGHDGGAGIGPTDEARAQLFGAIEEQLRRSAIREYKRIICFDRDILEKDPELKSGVLRVGEGKGTIHRVVAEHCRAVMKTKGCSVYVAPVVLQGVLTLYGTNKASVSLETIDQDTGARTSSGVLFFYDPPNGEIVEQLRQIERETERHVVAVHKIRFPEDAAPAADLADR